MHRSPRASFIRAMAIPLLGAVALTLVIQSAFAWSPPRVTAISADLKMKGFHDSTTFAGPLKQGVPIVIHFKNNAVLKLLPLAILDKTIQLQTFLTSGNQVLYDETFFTTYNADANLSEKNPKGDLVYHLKLNPHTSDQ